MRNLFVIILCILLAGSSQVATGQARRCNGINDQRYISRAHERPQLAIDFSQAASFKLSSRTTTYRVGELISLDMAMLNISGRPMFFDNPSGLDLTIEIRNEAGEDVKFNEYFITSASPFVATYSLLESKEIVVGHFQMFLGCNDEGLQQYQNERLRFEREMHQPHAEYHKGLFDRNLFVNWGEGCLEAIRPGKYTFTATKGNDYVIVSTCNPKVKTATGTIKSPPLVITITDK